MPEYQFKKKIKKVKFSWYTWYTLGNSDKRRQYTVTVKNKYDTLQETLEGNVQNDNYENFLLSIDKKELSAFHPNLVPN